MAKHMKDPTRVFTRGIADAVEQTPAFEQSLQGGGVIPSTWGDIASRLVETGHVEPSVAAVCDFLLIEQEDLDDPNIALTQPFVADMYFKKLKWRWAEEYKTQFGEKANGHILYLQNLMETEWATPEGAEAQADAIHNRLVELRSAKESESGLTDTDEQIDLLEIQRNALWSGITVTLADFAKAVLSYPDEYFFTPTELAKGLNIMIVNNSYLRLFTARYPNVLAQDVVIGADQIDTYLQEMGMVWQDRVEAFADARWRSIQGIFIAPHYSDLPLFAGNEK